MRFRERETCGEPEIEFSADVRVRELHFEEVPNPKVEFYGHPERRSDWISERENLPDGVQPGVVYHEAVVRLLIASETTAGGLERERMKITRQPPEQEDSGRKPEIEEEQQ